MDVIGAVTGNNDEEDEEALFQAALAISLQDANRPTASAEVAAPPLPPASDEVRYFNLKYIFNVPVVC
jgi:hypothetical protein